MATMAMMIMMMVPSNFNVGLYDSVGWVSQNLNLKMLWSNFLWLPCKDKQGVVVVLCTSLLSNMRMIEIGLDGFWRLA